MIDTAALQDWSGGTARASWARAGLIFLSLFIVAIVVFRDAWTSMAGIWINSSVYHQGLFVLPVSAGLILARRDWRREEPADDWLGVVPILAACILWLFSRAAGADIAGHFAVTLAIIGAVIVAFGRTLAAQWAFPLGFLFFMAPFGEELTPTLQDWASAAVAAGLNLAGVATDRDGFILSTSAGRFEMADSCAGLRFLLASAMLSALVSYLSFRTWRKRFAFIIVAIAAALVANWIRAFAIVLVATATDRRSGLGPEHVVAGWAFYGVLMLALAAIAHRFRDAPALRPPAAEVRATVRGSSSASLAAAALLAGSHALGDVADPGAQPLAPTIAHAAYRSDGFVTDAATPGWRPALRSGEWLEVQGYRSSAAAVTVAAAVASGESAIDELIGLRAADGVGWRRISVAMLPLTFAGNSMTVRVETIEDNSGRKLDAATLYVTDTKAFGSRAAASIETARRRLLREDPNEGALIIAAEHGINADPLDSIRRFAAGAEPVTQRRPNAVEGAND